MALLEYPDPETIEENMGSDAAPELLEPFDMGGPSLMRRILAHNPDILEAWHEYVEHLYLSNLDPYLVEYARVSASIANECEYCANAHGEILRQKYGHSSAEVLAIRDDDFEEFSDLEEAVIRFAKQAATEARRVSDSHIEALMDAGLDEGDVVGLLVVTSNSVAANVINDSLNVHHTDGRYQNPIELVEYSE